MGARVRAFSGVEEVLSLQERLVREPFSRSARGSHARDHWSVLVGDDPHPIAVDPEPTKDHGKGYGQEGELVARVVVDSVLQR